MNEFDVYLLSNGSMKAFPGNTLSHFSNQLSEAIYLEGDWTVAISEISYPTNIKNISETYIETVNMHSSVKEGNSVVRPEMKSFDIRTGVYCDIDDLLKEFEDKTSLTHYKENDKLFLSMDEDEYITFPSKEIPNILGLEIDVQTRNALQKYPYLQIKEEDQPMECAFPYDLMAGKHLMLIYINIIDYQNVADTKAPLLRAITTRFRVKNGCINNTQSVQHEKFDNLQFKKLLTRTISTIKIEIRHETGEFVPFIGTGVVAITLKFKRV